MIKVLLFDLSNTILFAKDKGYVGGLNGLNNQLKVDNPNYDFNDYFELDHEILERLLQLKTNYQISLFTSETIQEEPAIRDELRALFSPIFSALDVGFAKTNPQAYEVIAKKLGVSPEEIAFFDDNPTNITAAQQAGMNAFVYLNHQTLENALATE